MLLVLVIGILLPIALDRYIGCACEVALIKLPSKRSSAKSRMGIFFIEWLPLRVRSLSHTLKLEELWANLSPQSVGYSSRGSKSFN